MLRHALFAVVLFVSAVVCAAQTTTPCTVAGPGCMEKIRLGNEGKFSLVYRSFPLTQKNVRIERALIIVHGAGRNANDYFSSGVAGALIAGTLDKSIVIAPRYASNQGGECRDTLEPGEISWSCGGDNDWRGGGAGQGTNVMAFDLIDELISMLARKDLFPNLHVVVVSGHSAGGQFTNRYSTLARADKVSAVPVKYAVLNPSSYLYLDPTRLPASATCSPKGGCTAEFQAYADTARCPNYDRWRYGLQKRAGYNASISDEQLRKQLAARDVTYLVGEFDTIPVYGFDSSCSAMAQGPTRQARGINFWNYMRTKYEAKHSLVIVPACGHNGRCMYTADIAFPVIFPK